MFVAFYLNGTVSVVGDNYAVQSGPPNVVLSKPAGSTSTGTNASGNAAAVANPALAAPPLELGVWYNVSMAVSAQQLSWTLGDDSLKGKVTLDAGLYPPHGQLAIGLVDYGGASIDDLAVVNVD